MKKFPYLAKSIIVPLAVATVLFFVYSKMHSNIKFDAIWISYLFFLLFSYFLPVSIVQLFDYLTSRSTKTSYANNAAWKPGAAINIIFLLLLAVASFINVQNTDWLTGDAYGGYHPYSEVLYPLFYFIAPIIHIIAATYYVVKSHPKNQKPI